MSEVDHGFKEFDDYPREKRSTAPTIDEGQRTAIQMATIQSGMEMAQSLLIQRDDLKRRLDRSEQENHQLSALGDSQLREITDLRQRCEDLRIINRSLHGDNERLRAFAQLVRGATEKILEIDSRAQNSTERPGERPTFYEEVERRPPS